MGCTSDFYARDDLPCAHWDETEFSLMNASIFLALEVAKIKA